MFLLRKLDLIPEAILIPAVALCSKPDEVEQFLADVRDALGDALDYDQVKTPTAAKGGQKQLRFHSAAHSYNIASTSFEFGQSRVVLV